MIIISSGFPKSASTLLFLYTESLINSLGRSKGQNIFRKYNAEGFTPHFGMFNTAWYVYASMFGPVVIKTHAGPTFFIRVLISLGLAKAYYSVRDPRDAMLSALDHGLKARAASQQSDSDKAFAPFKSMSDVLPAFSMHLDRFLAWKKYGRAIFPRYEELMLHPETELKKIVMHVGIKSLDSHIAETVKHFAANRNNTKNFNKGDVSRYKSELSDEKIAAIESMLQNCVVSMGYELANKK